MKTRTISTPSGKQKIFTWTHCDVVRKMKQIAKKEKCGITFLRAGNGYGGFNYACCAGKTIMIAPFVKAKAGQVFDGFEVPRECSNPVECQFISFFHELAHIKLTANIPSVIRHYSWNDTSKFQFELWLTMLGVEMAHKKYGIKFSDESLLWLINEARTHVRTDDSAGGYGLLLLRADENGYQVKSQWEFDGSNNNRDSK